MLNLIPSSITVSSGPTFAREDPLTLDDIVRPSTGTAGVEEGHIKHSGLAVGRVGSGGRPGDGDGQAQFLALVLDADGAVGVEGVVGRDALAAGIEDGHVACDLVPAPQVGRQVEGRVRLGIEAEPVRARDQQVLTGTVGKDSQRGTGPSHDRGWTDNITYPSQSAETTLVPLEVVP